MSDIRRSAPIPLGIVLALVLSFFVFLVDYEVLNTIVYSRYSGLVDPNTSTTFFEVAWLLATLERMLDLTALVSLLLWGIVIISGVLVFRQPSNSVKMTCTAPLLCGGIWLIFAYKYANIVSFTLTHFLLFFLYRFLVTLGLVLFGTLLFCFPFWLVERRRVRPLSIPTGVLYTCEKCGATYRSIPIVCIECGEEREQPE